VYSDAVQFEVEIYQDENGQWIATAVTQGVTAKGRSEQEALSFLMEALSRHFKKS
jgi:predicted RNase H-like HicB family nuclease